MPNPAADQREGPKQGGGRDFRIETLDDLAALRIAVDQTAIKNPEILQFDLVGKATIALVNQACSAFLLGFALS